MSFRKPEYFDDGTLAFMAPPRKSHGRHHHRHHRDRNVVDVHPHVVQQIVRPGIHLGHPLGPVLAGHPLGPVLVGHPRGIVRMGHPFGPVRVAHPGVIFAPHPFGFYQ